MKARLRYFDFGRGLQTTRHGRSGSPDDYATFQDVEVDRGGVEARKGMVGLGVVAPGIGIIDFDGVDDNVVIPAGAGLAGLSLTQWTLDVLFVVDSIASTRYVLGRATATTAGIVIRHTSGGDVEIVVTDSAGTATTLTYTSVAAGTLCGLSLTRDGSALAAWMNGTSKTGTMSATNALASGQVAIGSDNSGGWLDGAVDRVTLWAEVRTVRDLAYMRLLNPRNPKVRFDYVLTQGGGGDVCDRGRKNAHAIVNGTPAFTRTALALNAGAIQALAFNQRRNGTREIVAVSHGRFYTATVQ